MRAADTPGPGSPRQPDPRRSGPGPAAPPDAGVLEPVAGTGTGLLREVGRMADGRRITYYSLPPDRADGGEA